MPCLATSQLLTTQEILATWTRDLTTLTHQAQVRVWKTACISGNRHTKRTGSSRLISCQALWETKTSKRHYSHSRVALADRAFRTSMRRSKLVLRTWNHRVTCADLPRQVMKPNHFQVTLTCHCLQRERKRRLVTSYIQAQKSKNELTYESLYDGLTNLKTILWL